MHQKGVPPTQYPDILLESQKIEKEGICDAKVDTMNEILDEPRLFDIGASTEQIELLEETLKDCHHEVDIGRLECDTTRIEGKVRDHRPDCRKRRLAPPEEARPDECCVTLWRGLESLERSDARARTLFGSGASSVTAKSSRDGCILFVKRAV
jgi:hypothetical protein